MTESFIERERRLGQIAGKAVIPISAETVWQAAKTAVPGTASATAALLAPLTVVTPDTTADSSGIGTSVMVRLAYTAALSAVTTQVRVKVLGIDNNSNIHWLVSGSNSEFAVLTATTATDIKVDVSAGVTYQYTPISSGVIFDLNGCDKFQIMTERALLASSTAGVIQFKVV
jgi:hypothetical protein